MKYLSISGIFLFLLLNTLYSQQDSTWSEEQQNDIIEISTSENEDNLVVDYMEDLLENPVNVNSAGISELLRIPGMRDADAYKIIEYRKNSGHIFTLFELYSIRGIDTEKLKTYFRYMCVEEKFSTGLKEPEHKGILFTSDLRSRISGDLQVQRGFKENIYQGNRYKIYNRLKVKSGNNYRIGLLSEKDPGEKDYMDHSAFYFQVKDKGIIKSFVAGDYNIEFGKGIAMWSPYGFSALSALFADRKGRNIVPYLSTNESQFLRGAAVDLTYSGFGLTAFYSNRIKDGVIDSADYNISSLSADGYHRTRTELNRKEKISQIASGAVVQFTQDFISTELLYYNLVSSYPFSSVTKYPSGYTFNYLSLAYTSSLKRIVLSGEASLFRNKIAYLNSIQFNAADDIKLIFIFRSTPENYFSFFSPAGRNGSGIYTGISINSVPGDINIYYNSFKFRNSSSVFPVNGNELVVDYNINPSRSILCRLRYKKTYQHMFENSTSSEIKRQSITTEVTYKISRAMKWKCRLDYSLYSEQLMKINEPGYSFYQEAVYTLTNKIAELYGRVTMFDTKSYNSRLYLFEKDVTGSFSMNPLFNEGMRWYLGININLMKGYKLQCRYSETYKPDAEFLGSGYNEIKGNLDNQFSFQIDIKF